MAADPLLMASDPLLMAADQKPDSTASSVSQNATQKLGIRLLPSVHAALFAEEPPSDFLAFAFAAMLRYLSPVGEQVIARRLCPRKRRTERSPAQAPYRACGVPCLHA